MNTRLLEYYMGFSVPSPVLVVERKSLELNVTSRSVYSNASNKRRNFKMAEKVNTDCFDEENPNYCNGSMLGEKKVFPYIAPFHIILI